MPDKMIPVKGRVIRGRGGKNKNKQNPTRGVPSREQRQLPYTPINKPGIKGGPRPTAPGYNPKKPMVLTPIGKKSGDMGSKSRNQRFPQRLPSRRGGR